MSTNYDLIMRKLRQQYKENGATDDEAESMASKEQAQEESQEKLNGWQKFGAGFTQFTDSIGRSFLDLGEGFVDAHAFVLGSIAEATGNENLAEKTRDFIKYDATSDLIDNGNAFGTGFDLWKWMNLPNTIVFGKENREVARNTKVLPDVLETIGSGVGSSLGMGAISSIPYVGWALTGMAAGGANAEQALADENTSMGEAMGYGMISGGVEVASELLVGKALGAIGKGINKATGGSAVSTAATQFGLGSASGGNWFTNLVKEFGEEGAEEAVGEMIDPIARKLTIESDSSWSDVWNDNYANKDYWTDDVWTSFWEGGLSAIAMGGVGTAVGIAKTGGVRQYNATLQVRAVAEINEEIKELEKNNVGGMNDARIEALTERKKTIKANFERAYADYAEQYSRQSQALNEIDDAYNPMFVNSKLTNEEQEAVRNERLEKAYKSLEEANAGKSKWEQRQADKTSAILSQMDFENNRNLRYESALETVKNTLGTKAKVDKNIKNSFADNSENKIVYSGKSLNKKKWVDTVVHEMGHIVARNNEDLVGTILSKMDSKEFKDALSKTYSQYEEAYGNEKIAGNSTVEKYAKSFANETESTLLDKAKEFYSQNDFVGRTAFDNAKTFEEKKQQFIFDNARVEMSTEEVAMKRLGAIFDNVLEFERAIKNEKLPVLKRLKQRIVELYKKPTKRKKPSNYYEIINALQNGISKLEQENKKASKAKDKRYELSNKLDSEGNELTKEQVEFFKDSKVRDEDGNLLVVYHGTDANFTIFKGSDISSFHGRDVVFTTNDKNMAKSYIRTNNGKVISGYINLTHPLIIEANGKRWNNLDYSGTKPLSVEKQKVFDSINEMLQTDKNIKIDDFIEGIKKIANVKIDLDRDLNYCDFTVNLDSYRIMFSLDFNADNIITKSSLKEAIEDINADIKLNLKNKTTNELVSYAIESKKYDGIIFKNIIDYGVTAVDASDAIKDVYVAFDSNQIKDTNNVSPTSSNDIRYELSEKEFDEVEEFNNGDPIPKDVKKFLRGNSRFTFERDYNGDYLAKVYYHGSKSAGFMKFNSDAIFLTDDLERASSYARNSNLVVTKKFESFEEAVEWWYGEGEELLKGTAYEGLDLIYLDGYKEDIESAESLRELLKRYAEMFESETAPKEAIQRIKDHINNAKVVLEGDNDSIIEVFESLEELNENLVSEIQISKNYELGLEEYDEDYDYDDYDDVAEDNSRGVYAGYISLKNPLVINARGNNFLYIQFRGERMSTDDIVKIVKAEGKHDGVIFLNIMDNGGRDQFNDLGLGEVTVLFNSNQFKAIDNEHPTENNDIRYELDEDNKKETKPLKMNSKEWDKARGEFYEKVKGLLASGVTITKENIEEQIQDYPISDMLEKTYKGNKKEYLTDLVAYRKIGWNAEGKLANFENVQSISSKLIDKLVALIDLKLGEGLQTDTVSLNNIKGELISFGADIERYKELKQRVDNIEVVEKKEEPKPVENKAETRIQEAKNRYMAQGLSEDDAKKEMAKALPIPHELRTECKEVAESKLSLDNVSQLPNLKKSLEQIKNESGSVNLTERQALQRLDGMKKVTQEYINEIVRNRAFKNMERYSKRIDSALEKSRKADIERAEKLNAKERQSQAYTDVLEDEEFVDTIAEIKKEYVASLGKVTFEGEEFSPYAALRLARSYFSGETNEDGKPKKKPGEKSLFKIYRYYKDLAKRVSRLIETVQNRVEEIKKEYNTSFTPAQEDAILGKYMKYTEWLGTVVDADIELSQEIDISTIYGMLKELEIRHYNTNGKSKAINKKKIKEDFENKLSEKPEEKIAYLNSVQKIDASDDKIKATAKKIEPQLNVVGLQLSLFGTEISNITNVEEQNAIVKQLKEYSELKEEYDTLKSQYNDIQETLKENEAIKSESLLVFMEKYTEGELNIEALQRFADEYEKRADIIKAQDKMLEDDVKKISKISKQLESANKRIEKLKEDIGSYKAVNKELKKNLREAQKSNKKLEQMEKKFKDIALKYYIESNGMLRLPADEVREYLNDLISYIVTDLDAFYSDNYNGTLGKKGIAQFKETDLQAMATAISNQDWSGAASIFREAIGKAYIEYTGENGQKYTMSMNDILDILDNDAMARYLSFVDYNFEEVIKETFEEFFKNGNVKLSELGKRVATIEFYKNDLTLQKLIHTAYVEERQATTVVKNFLKFMTENTTITRSRLNGVDDTYRFALIELWETLSNAYSLDALLDGSVRRALVTFYDKVKTVEDGKPVVESNGVYLDSDVVSLFEILSALDPNDMEKRAETIETLMEMFKMKNASSEELEAKVIKLTLRALKKFTDNDVMHNRYFTVGDLTIKGTDFTNQIVQSVMNFREEIGELNWNWLKSYVSPRNIFLLVAGYDENSLVMQLYKELEKGTVKTMQAEMELVTPVLQFFRKNKKYANELKRDSKKYNRTITYGDTDNQKKITASTTLLIDLYEIMQDEHGKTHLLNDGYDLGNNKLIGFESEKELKSLEESIVKELDLNGKTIYAEYVKLLNQMYNLAKEYKVITDNDSRGFTNVVSGFYYPVVVSDFNLNLDIANESFKTGNNYGGADLSFAGIRGFNKSRTSSRGGIRITNSYAKLMNHIKGIASYYGVDSAILNFGKLYNYRVTKGVSAGNMIRQLFGKDYKKFDKYLGDLFKDMRKTNKQLTVTDASFSKIENTIRSGIVTATLVNPKVIATQPASLFAAMKYIEPKHILSSLKEGFSLGKKYPQLPTAGSYRYFDQSATKAETGGMLEGDSPFAKAQRWLGKGISGGDHYAINVEWVACLKQTKNEDGSWNVEKAEELFNRVVLDTQPNNSPLGKAEIMRSDNEIIKLLTMYRSQAMQNFNIAYNAINQLKVMNQLAKKRGYTKEQRKKYIGKAEKELFRSLTALFFEGVLYTLIGTVFRHFVDGDWDEDEFWENLALDFSVDFFNDNILGIMPILNKLDVDLEEKTKISLDNITLGWAENLLESLQNLTTSPNPKKFIQVFSYGTGIPAATNYKYTKALLQYMNPKIAYDVDSWYNGTDTTSKAPINDAITSGKLPQAKELYKQYTSHSLEFSEEAIDEMFALYSLGIKTDNSQLEIAVKKIPETLTYDDTPYTVDKTQFRNYYSEVAKRISKMIKSQAYKKLSSEKKASVLNYLLKLYYNRAVHAIRKNVTGQELTFIEMVLDSGLNLTNKQVLALADTTAMETDENSKKAEKIQKYINKLDISRQEKYFLYLLNGYSLTDDKKKLLITYLCNNGLSRKNAKTLLGL